MLTTLPAEIKKIPAAKRFLYELFKNGESYHPDDDANELSAELFTPAEAKQLNKLMADILALEGNEDIHNMAFDPYGFLLDLNNEVSEYAAWQETCEI